MNVSGFIISSTLSFEVTALSEPMALFISIAWINTLSLCSPVGVICSHSFWGVNMIRIWIGAGISAISTASLPHVTGVVSQCGPGKLTFFSFGSCCFMEAIGSITVSWSTILTSVKRWNESFAFSS